MMCQTEDIYYFLYRKCLPVPGPDNGQVFGVPFQFGNSCAGQVCKSLQE